MNAASAPASAPASVRRRLVLAAAATAVAVGLIAPAARADRFDWIGGGTTANWTNIFNWGGLQVPGNNGTDSVFFGESNARTTSIVNQPFAVDSVQFLPQQTFGSQQFSFDVNRDNNAILSVRSAIINNTSVTQTFAVPITPTGQNFSVSNLAGNGGGGGGAIVFNEYFTLNNLNVLTNTAAGSTISYNAPINGTGNLFKAGSGTVVLAGANTFSGTVTIQGGTLSINTGNNLGAIANNVVLSRLNNAGSIPTFRRTGAGISRAAINLSEGEGDLQADADWEITGDVTGGFPGPLAGSLGKTGAATLTLSGNLSYTGATLIKAGTLQLSGNARLPDTTDVVINGTLAYGDNMSDTVKSLSSFGTLRLGNGTRLTTGGGEYGGLVTGAGGLGVNNNATLTLSNTINDYTGGTDIGGGASLVLTNPFGNSTGTGRVTVQAGGRLAGYGTGAATVLVNGGTDAASGFTSVVSPGGPNGALAGTLTVGGLDFDGKGGFVRIDVDGGQIGTTIDRLAVTGDADLREGSLELLRRGSNFFPNLGLSPTAVLTVGGTRTGVFSSVDGVRVTDTLSFAVTYDGSNVNIRLADAADPNLDGARTIDDFLVLGPTYRTGAGDQIWVTGDVTGDGLVNLGDLTLLSDLYAPQITGMQYAQIGAISGQEETDLRALRGDVVPEPTSLALLGIGGLGLLRRRSSSGGRGRREGR